MLRRPPRAPNRSPDRSPLDDDPALAYLRDDPGDRRRLRIAIAVAVLCHGLLLAVPTLQSEAGPVEPEEERKLVEIKPMRFKPPEPPPPERQREPRAVEIPVPDPTPDELEPLRPVEPIPVVDDLPDWDLDLILPDAPPPPPEPGDDGPLMVGGEIDRPVGIHTPDPPYTELARRARIQGTVILQVTLGRKGEVTEVKVLRALGGGLSESAERTVRGWRYHPATLNGKPVPVYMTVTIHFTLQ